jgi:PAS domain S-box-containing protein
MNLIAVKGLFRKYGLGLIMVWTCILTGILLFILNLYHENTLKEATREAKDYHGLNLHYRRWGAQLGGVYAATEKVTPNPYLTVPNRDVTTNSGKSLTLVNPAYMTRMVFEAIQQESQNPVINRLVSLKPLNPINAPNAWELETLKLFENREFRERSQVLSIDKRPYLQYMAAFITEESCLKCHALQGYKLGDVRGGMSIAIPMSEYLTLEAERRNSLMGVFALLWILGTSGIVASSTKRHRQTIKLFEEKSTAIDLAERYAIVTNGIPSLIAHVGKNERYLFVNRAYADWVELPPEQIIGKTVKEVIGEDNFNLSRPYMQQVFEGISGSYERQVTSPFGSMTQSIDFVPQVDGNGGIIAYFAIINDITERKKIERSLREHTERLESEIFERQQIQEQLEEQSLRLEEEISERQIAQEQLEEQASMLEEEVAERQQAVVDLQKAEHFLHTIIETEPECIKLLDVDCNLLLMNRAGLEMIGADSFEQVRGQCVSPLVNESYRNAFVELTNRAFQGISGSIEFEITGLKARSLWMASMEVPFRDENDTIVAVLAISRDITELKRSEEALRKSEDRFRGIAESLADWIWEVDASGRYTYSSESSERVLGYKPEEIIGKSIYEFIDPQDVERFRGVLKVHTRDITPIKNLENWNITKGGGKVCLITNGAPILDSQGELIGYRGVDSDVTEQRMFERQATQQQKLESIGLLAGGIAHDFNNMLVPIFGYAEMISMRHSADEKTAGYSGTILKAAEKAKDLVSRLLSFSRQQTFKTEKLDLNEIIDSFMVILQRTIRESIEIKNNLSLEPCIVLADRTQIEQILLNLAVNAQDAINGTGCIKIETGHLYFDHEYCLRHPGSTPGRYVMIAFSDTGSGIDEGTLPYIFDPFFTTKPTGHGTGLGLSTIFGVVKQHDGSIDVDSQAGVGTTFTLYFPEITGEAEPQEQPSVAEKLDKQVGTILVVEDNPMVLSLVREILEGNGHHVISAAEPAQALDIVRSHGETFDLLVSDVVMPQMNGPELYERISELVPGLKVLYMSGYAGVVSVHNGHLEEEANYISKPFTMEAFIRKVSEVLADV